MVSVQYVDEINNLQEDEQAIVISLIKSLTRRNAVRTKAKKQFDEICKKHEGSALSMEEIDALISEARSN